MACNCGEKTSCACTFNATASVSIEGSGTSESPLIISVETASIEGLDTDSVLTSVTGDGSTEHPYALSMRVADDIMDGMWNKWFGSQAEYDALIDNPLTLYVVNPGA